MVRQVGTDSVCETCGHPKSVHEERRIRGVPPDFLLHEQCLARGCSCAGYTGVLWERQEPIAVHQLIQVPA